MKNYLLLAAAVIAAGVMTGCTSIQTAEKFNAMPIGDGAQKPIAHVSVKMSGCYLFGFIPLFCGSVASAGKTAMFSDTLKTDYGVLLLTRTCRAMGGTRMYDIYTTRHSVFLFPLLSIDTMNVSGTTTGVKELH